MKPGSISLLILLVQNGLASLNVQKTDEKKLAKLPPCSACSILTESFAKGLERTSRGKFEGGDAAWEEKNQGKGYAISEVRFVEIQESLCRDVDRGEAQCHDNHHEWEEHLEQWWSLGHDKPELKQWLCQDKLKVCCPDGTFGADCQPCSKMGTNGQLCSGKGKCKGNGTRKGNGACLCDKGYSGETCDTCANGFFKDNDDKCSSCHKSCLDQCTGPGPNQCIACKNGYLMHTEYGCHDLDECAEGSSNCRSNEFCVNTDGSFRCHSCDKSCSGCTSEGPDSCKECAEGYVKSGKVCVTKEAAETNATLEAASDVVQDLESRLADNDVIKSEL